MNNQRGFTYEEPPAISARREARRAQGVLDRAGMNPDSYVPGYGVPAAEGRNYGLTAAKSWGDIFGGNRDASGNLADRGIQSIGIPQVSARAHAGLSTNLGLPTPGTVTERMGPISARGWSTGIGYGEGGQHGQISEYDPRYDWGAPSTLGVSGNTKTIGNQYGTGSVSFVPAPVAPTLGTAAFNPRVVGNSRAETIPGGQSATPYQTQGWNPGDIQPETASELAARRAANAERVRAMIVDARS